MMKKINSFRSNLNSTLYYTLKGLFNEWGNNDYR